MDDNLATRLISVQEAKAAADKAQRFLEKTIEDREKLEKHVSDLEERSKFLPLDDDTIAKHLQKIEVAREKIKIASRVCAHAESALAEANDIVKEAKWREEKDALARRVAEVNREFEKFDEHIDAIVAMCTDAEQVGREVNRFLRRHGGPGIDVSDLAIVSPPHGLTVPGRWPTRIDLRSTHPEYVRAHPVKGITTRGEVISARPADQTE